MYIYIYVYIDRAGRLVVGWLIVGSSLVVAAIFDDLILRNMD